MSPTEVERITQPLSDALSWMWAMEQRYTALNKQAYFQRQYYLAAASRLVQEALTRRIDAINADPIWEQTWYGDRYDLEEQPSSEALGESLQFNLLDELDLYCGASLERLARQVGADQRAVRLALLDMIVKNWATWSERSREYHLTTRGKAARLPF
jgi:hypothetical protein